ncbi:helix-turn-helix domain-containing protein [Sediminibacillus albus]|uniref:Uncharacterized protein YpbB n=1 Tax=Sediminibacillus albus TaxID=407036 RepID=A0A1G8VLD7_9BACI|nr:helix-turn-helix domain-containing protein [Sediminibacillus albus]SDJ66822.1 Uncharacterized protein YpbB [Sediminibacillus albus]
MLAENIKLTGNQPKEHSIVLDLIILDCISKINKERSLAAIYHLLTGKRSSQTLQDAHIYHLTGYFGICKGMEKAAFDQLIQSVIDRRFAKPEGDDAELTGRGIDFLTGSDSSSDLAHFNGLAYDRAASLFYDRLSLFIQTATNLESGNHNFIPVTENTDTLRWMKRFYNANKHQLRNLLDGLYQELLIYLHQLPDEQASVFVKRLSGYSRFGLSKAQLAITYGYEKQDFNVIYLLLLHRLLNYVLYDNEPTPTLALFTKDIVKEVFLTDSARKTNQLLNSGRSIEQIGRIRMLKESTIHDHLIEIAYAHPHFPLDRYVPQQAIKEIARTVDRLQTRKLKIIKQALDNRYSYLQIRLVLAIHKSGWQKGENI